jgi:hypothetical protein
MPILLSLCYNSSLVTWMVVSLTVTKLKPLIFSVSGATTKVKSLLWPTISRPICHGVRHPFGAQEHIFINERQLWICWWGTLYDERMGLPLYSCCWSLPAQSFLGPSCAGLQTICYCLKFETPPFWRAISPYLYPAGQCGPVIPPGTGFAFCHQLAGLQ